jgi:hypothetical protein
MNHQVSEVKVYVTTDYKIFERVRGNRALNETKIKKMIRDMNHGLNFLADFPIVTSESGKKLQVHDGQHRLEAAIKLKKPVYYIVRKAQMDLVETARVNSLQERWKPKDFINCYMEQGIKDYGVLQDFIEIYSCPVSTALRLLHYGTAKSDSGAGDLLRKYFERGQFKASHVKQAKEIMETCRLFQAFDKWSSRPFIAAITRLLSGDLCDMDRLVEKFNENPDMPQARSTPKDYLVLLENIYNKGKHKREVIYQ